MINAAGGVLGKPVVPVTALRTMNGLDEEAAQTGAPRSQELCDNGKAVAKQACETHKSVLM